VRHNQGVATPPRDILAERGYKVPRHLDDSQLAVLEANPEYRAHSGGKCPVCEGEGSFLAPPDGERLECPDDDFGHVATRLMRLYWLNNIPFQYQILDWTKWPMDNERKRAAKEVADGFIQSIDGALFYGMGLNIQSKTLGTGKTWLATSIQKELAKLGYTTWFLQFKEAVGLYQEGDKARKRLLEDKIRGVQVLVIDEVRPGDASDGQAGLYANKLEDLVRGRTNGNLVNIITTNLDEAQLEKKYDRVYSLLSSKATMIDLEGEDARITTDLWGEQMTAALNGWRSPVT
jgi:DNA replication protein DnaC